MSGLHNGVERKVMDIRQLCEEKPKLGWLVDVRFNILHNLRRLDELEPQVAAHVARSGQEIRPSNASSPQAAPTFGLPTARVPPLFGGCLPVDRVRKYRVEA